MNFQDEAKVKQIIAIVTTHSVSCYSISDLFCTLAKKGLNLILLQYDVMCAIHLPTLFIGKAPHKTRNYGIYITTENVLVRYDSYLPKTEKHKCFFLYKTFFLFPILISVIFAKSFACLRVIHNVLLKFDVKKFVL